jgi:hypothetical protein
MMKTRFVLALLVGLFALPALAADLTGVWAGQLTDPQGNKHDLTFHLKADGNGFTGTMTGGPPNGEEQAIVNGKVEGDQLAFDVKVQSPGEDSLLLTYKGKLVGNRIQGSQQSPMGNLRWEVTRK